MSWVLAVVVTAAVCVLGSIAVLRGEPKSYDEPSALLPPFLTVITGVTLSLFYFGLDYVLSTIFRARSCAPRRQFRNRAFLTP